MNDKPKQNIGKWLISLGNALNGEAEHQAKAPAPSSLTTKELLLLEQWKLASALHRHIDTQILSQLNYFIGFNLALFTLLGGALSLLDFVPSLVIILALSVLGVFISNNWYRSHIRQVAYHSYRVLQARETEKLLLIDGEQILTLYAKGVNEQELFSLDEIAKTKNTDLIKTLCINLRRGWTFVGGVSLGILAFLLVWSLRQ